MRAFKIKILPFRFFRFPLFLFLSFLQPIMNGYKESYQLQCKLFKSTGDSVNKFEYASIIGSLRYDVDCTKPNIAYAVGLLCRFISKPSLEHLNAIERVMRYLKKIQHYKKEGYAYAALRPHNPKMHRQKLRRR